MSDPTHLFVWSASSVNDGITHQKTLRKSCAVTGFSKNYTSVLLNIQLQRLFNIAYILKYISEMKKVRLKNIPNAKTKNNLHKA